MQGIAWDNNGTTYNVSACVTGILDLAEGDTVSLYVRHNLGSNLSVGATDNGITSSFGGFKLIGV